MPDFGLTEALAAALKASGKAAPEAVAPAEAKLAGGAAKAAPEAAAPVVPAAAPVESAAPAPAPPAEAPLNPSAPPEEAPPPAPGDVATLPDAAPAAPDVAAGAADATPPGAEPPTEPTVAPAPPPPPEGQVAPANRLPPQPSPEFTTFLEERAASARAAAQRFMSANMGDFPAAKLNMTHMPNVDVINAPDQLKAALLQVADDNRSVIESARGKAASDVQLKGLAQDFAVNADTLQQRFDQEFGAVTNTAEMDQRRAVIMAARMVEQNEVGMTATLSDRILSGNATSDDIVQWQQHNDAIVNWATRLAGTGAESGRNLRALGIQVDGTLPREVMDHIAGIIKQNNPDMQETAQAIKAAMTPGGINSIVSGLAKWQRDTPLARRLLLAPWSALQRVFINGILWGPQTWAKIFVGNNSNLITNAGDIFAAGIGRGMYGLAARLGGFPTAAEGATISDAFAHVHGVISGSADALRVAGRVFATGRTAGNVTRATENAGVVGRLSTNEILPEIQGTWFGALAHGLDTINDASGSRIIGGIDQFTRSMGERGYIQMMSAKEVRARLAAGTLKDGDAEQIMQDMITNPSPEMKQAATAWGARMTFQSPFPEGGAGEAFQTVLNKVPALRFIFPFMRTATNIFKQSLVERTPLALFSARIRNQIAAGGFEGDIAKSRIATGTALISMYAWMAIHDRITGEAPKDAKERAIWELDGRTPNSVRITDPLTGKDTWRSIAWFEPHATVASAVADVVRLMSYIHGNDEIDTMRPHDDMLTDAVKHIAASVIDNTGSKSYLQGAAQFAEMYNDPQRMFTSYANTLGANMVPMSGALKFARNVQDPYLRQAYTLRDKVENELPATFLTKGSKSLAARPDVFGEPRMHNGGNSILGPLNPLPGSPSQKDDVTDEIQSVMEQTRTAPISMPSTRLSFGGGGKGIQDGIGMKLTPEEYSDYVTKSRSDPVFNGLTFREQLEKTINTPVYQKAAPADRAAFLANVQHNADRAGREALYKDNEDFRERITEWTAERNRIKLGQ